MHNSMDVGAKVLQDLKSLTSMQRALLRRGNIRTVSELLLSPPNELSKRLKTNLSDAQSITDAVCKELYPVTIQLDHPANFADHKFTTGDALLDEAIGGGIRTGMVWELVGESASGKTQLALQLSLLVQVKHNLGGLSGSACYLTTHAKLPTKRLIQLTTEHPLLSSSVCSLSDIHTRPTPTVELLMRTLTSTLPNLQKEIKSETSKKPIRLVVIDSISSLFHAVEKQSSAALFERAKALTELSHIMHSIASRDDIAFVVINEVTDVFIDYNAGHEIPLQYISYREQSRWFNGAHSMPQEESKEATLGLVWANQVNARLMLTRTTRRMHSDEQLPGVKRQRIGDVNSASPSLPIPTIAYTNEVDQVCVIRRLSVVFSSVSNANSVDFVITKEGVSVVSKVILASPTNSTSQRVIGVPHKDMAQELAVEANKEMVQPFKPSSTLDTSNHLHDTTPVPDINADFLEMDPLEGVDSDNLEVIPSSYPEERDELHDDSQYWGAFDEAPYDTYDKVNFDEVDAINIEADIQASQA